MTDESDRLCWIILTQGTRPTEVAAAVESLGDAFPVVVVLNGAPAGTEQQLPANVTAIRADENLGVPGGRHRGVAATESEFIGFLDDDAAMVSDDAAATILAAFDVDPSLAAASLKITDEHGEVARRHIPRAGSAGADRAGPAATFLGGASVIRRSAYEAAGGYWAELHYAHEELDLSWRLHDRGYRVGYLSDVVVYHPRLPISRHDDGWRLTGRNRVMIARRNLPWPIAIVHVSTWLGLGLWRAPNAACKRAYAGGWWDGWRHSVDRAPIGWATIRRLARAGRPPLI